MTLTLESYRKKLRRSWPPERRARDKARRDKARRVSRYTPNRIRSADTVGMIEIENDLVGAFCRFDTAWVKLWQLLRMSVGNAPESIIRPHRQVRLAVLTRLIRERKVLRDRKHNQVRLADWWIGANFKSELGTMEQAAKWPVIPFYPNPFRSEGT
jgi:hypothetical protein